MHRLLCLTIFVPPALWGGADEDLLSAARTGHLAQVRALVEQGAALETKTPYGQTPLYLAAMSGHEPVVEYLLDKGARSDVRDTFYKAPMLAFVLQRKHYGIARLLVSKGGGAPDENLEAVAPTGRAELVAAVLTKGKPSQAALDRAYEGALTQKHAEIADLLKRAGAQEPAPPADVDLKVLESYAGTYKSEQFPLEIRVFVKDGKLMMQAGGQPEFAVKAKSATVFAFSPARVEVEFDSPSSFTLKQNTMVLKYKKVTQ